jgi:hypothetical protein
VSQARVAAAETRRKFRNPEKGELPPLEAVIGSLVKTKQTEKSKFVLESNAESVEQ